MFAKTDVNGENEDPIFTFLKSRCPSNRDEFRDTKLLYYTPLRQSDIRWNFAKFLIDHIGQPFRRYDDGVNPSELTKDIDLLLKEVSKKPKQSYSNPPKSYEEKKKKMPLHYLSKRLNQYNKKIQMF